MEENAFKITCLGGAGAIGMNLYIYETAKSAVILDCGIMFAPEYAAVNAVLPDISYLKEIKKKIRALLVTHGHEDHIGGIRNLLEHGKFPIYAGRFASELILSKLKNPRTLDIKTLEPHKEYAFGGIDASFFPVKHSIPDTFGAMLTIAGKTVVHLSDFAELTPFPKILEKRDVYALMLDSTNAANLKEELIGEGDVGQEFVKIAKKAEGRVFFTTFASNVERIGSVFSAAKQTGRKVVLVGAAVERATGIAERLGYLAAGDTLINVKTAEKMERDKLIYVLSGCQGETGSALSNVVYGERPAINIDDGDVLVFSSRVIPGNEKNVNGIINQASRLGALVITGQERHVHVSGHAGPKELTRVIEALKPRHFLPIHGEFRHMAAHARIARELGVDKSNIHFLDAGVSCTFEERDIRREEFPVSPRYMDHYDTVFNEDSFKTLKTISREGLVIVYLSEKDFCAESHGVMLSNAELKSLRTSLNSLKKEEKKDREAIKLAAKKHLRKQTDRRPYVIVI